MISRTSKTFKIRLNVFISYPVLENTLSIFLFFVELFDFFRQQAYNSNATSGSSDQTFEVYSHLTGNSLLPVTFLAYFSRGVPFPYPTY